VAILTTVMIRLVERQNLFWGRGLFLPSFPDPGIAQLVGALSEAGETVRVHDGTWWWLERLLDPDRVRHRLRQGSLPGRAERLTRLQQRGDAHLVATLERAREVLEVRREEDFFDVTLLERAVYVLEGSFALFEHDVRRDGAARHPWIAALADELVRDDPLLVGFSIAGYSEPVTAALIEAVRARSIVAVGGGWLTLGLSPGALARRCEEWGLDALVAGPGEATLPRLVRAIRRGDPQTGLPNVATGDAAAIRLEPLSDPPTNHDFGPLADRPYFAPAPIYPLQSNRGCHWKRCRFCPQAYNVHPYVEAEAETVAAEVSRLRAAYGARDFFFVDECISPRFARRFTEALGGANPRGLRFTAMVRPEGGFREETLEGLAAVGFRSLSWGVEAGRQRVLDLMNKGTRLDRVKQVLARSHHAGIANYAFMMIGFPGERPAESRAVIDLLAEQRAVIDGAQLSRFVAYETSEVGQAPDQFGLTLGEASDADELGTRRILEGGADRATLDALYREFHARYDELVSGRFVSARYQYFSGYPLLVLLYQRPRGD